MLTFQFCAIGHGGSSSHADISTPRAFDAVMVPGGSPSRMERNGSARPVVSVALKWNGGIVSMNSPPPVLVMLP